MKVLYNFWGHLSDKINISSPDGNATYTPWILNEFMNRGWDVYCFKDGDKESIEKYGKNAFKAFSQNKRYGVYKIINFLENKFFPEFDLIILEWRFSTKDNQLSKDNLKYSPDLEIQENIIKYAHENNIPIVVFDLDYKFTTEDEVRVKPWKVIETALFPREGHESVFIPMDFNEMNQFSTQIPRSGKLLVYIGNDYNRREDIEKKIIPFSKKHFKCVHFFGNWLKEDKKELREKWNDIEFHDRVGFQDFREILKQSMAIPLLATEEYKERGFMTMRILETLLFGSIPIGYSDFKGIDKFLPKELIVDMNNYEESMNEVYVYLNSMGFLKRIELRTTLIEKLKFMDVKYFVDKILEGINENGKT